MRLLAVTSCWFYLDLSRGKYRQLVAGYANGHPFSPDPPPNWGAANRPHMLGTLRASALWRVIDRVVGKELRMGKRARAGDGQPRSNRRKKCDALTVRLLPAQKAELENRAAVVGMKVTSYARHVLLIDRPLSAARVNDAALVHLSKLIFEINKVGVNLNQLVRFYNTTGQPFFRDEVSEQLARINDAVKEVRSFACELSNKTPGVS